MSPLGRHFFSSNILKQQLYIYCNSTYCENIMSRATYRNNEINTINGRSQSPNDEARRQQRIPSCSHAVGRTQTQQSADDGSIHASDRSNLALAPPPASAASYSPQASGAPGRLYIGAPRRSVVMQAMTDGQRSRSILVSRRRTASASASASMTNRRRTLMR